MGRRTTWRARASGLLVAFAGILVAACGGDGGEWLDANDMVGAAEVVRADAHCEWDGAVFLRVYPDVTLSEQKDSVPGIYLRDPKDVVYAKPVPYEHDTVLPGDAVDTGIHRGKDRIWTSPSHMDHLRDDRRRARGAVAPERRVLPRLNGCRTALSG